MPISAKLANSLEVIERGTPDTIQAKKEATGLLSRIKPSHRQMLCIVNHLHSIGADRDVLSSSKESNRQILHKWYQTLVINNPRFPRDLPIAFVLDEFSLAILQQKVELRGHNLHAHMRAFFAWMDSYEHSLREKHWHRTNPEIRPKALPETGSRTKEQEQADNQRVADALKTMYGEDIPETMKKYLS